MPGFDPTLSLADQVAIGTEDRRRRQQDLQKINRQLPGSSNTWSVDAGGNIVGADYGKALDNT